MRLTTEEAVGALERRVYWHTTTTPVQVELDELPERVDVAVIGAGFTGLSAARRIASSGGTVAVLERREVGSGASSRNAGMCHPGYSVGPRRLVRRYGSDRGRALYQDSETAFDVVEELIRSEGIDAEVTRAGQLGLAFAPVHVPGLQSEHAELAEVGVSSRYLDQGDLRGELSSTRYFGGLLVDRCLGLNPARLVNGLARAAINRGAAIHERTDVERLDRTADGRFRVITNRGPVVADQVVVATSGHTGGLVPWLRRRIVSLSSYIIVTEPLDPELATSVSPADRMFYDSKNFLYYWRLTSDRRLLFGGRASFMPTSLERTSRILHRGMVEVYPQLAETRIAYGWSGKVDFTYDRMPHVGSHAGITYALGYCGSGVALSVFLGDRVGDWVGGGPTPHLAEIPFPPVPAPYEGRAWFLPLVGEWYRLKDRLAARSIPATSAGVENARSTS